MNNNEPTLSTLKFLTQVKSSFEEIEMLFVCISESKANSFQTERLASLGKSICQNWSALTDNNIENMRH